MHLEYRHAAKLAAVFACLFALSPLGGRAQGLGLPDIVAERAIVVDEKHRRHRASVSRGRR